MDASKIAENNEMIFELAQREFGIKPLVTVADMENPEGPDKTLMASYLTSFYEYFRKESIRPPKMARKSDDSEEKVPRKIPGNRSPRQQPSVGKIASRFRQRKVSLCVLFFNSHKMLCKIFACANFFHFSLSLSCANKDYSSDSDSSVS